MRASPDAWKIAIFAHVTSMPHGDFSDLAGFTLIAGGVQQMVWPALQFASFGGLLRPFFRSNEQHGGRRIREGT